MNCFVRTAISATYFAAFRDTEPVLSYMLGLILLLELCTTVA
jgi:hypothetical protein